MPKFSMRKLRPALILTGYLGGVMAAAAGCQRTYDAHYATGIPLIVGGILLCLPHIREVRTQTRHGREQLLLLCIRIYPGHTAAWISKELRWRPGRLQPMLDQLVVAGELERRTGQTYWSAGTPRLDPHWAAKRETI